tara:strand:+ start:459 stop:1757 length:1299 start_codon:yes stop_codon:yes gene_type:complete
VIIKNIISREVLDSRGNPTIEVEVHLNTKKIGRAIVPSGASTGAKEALELRDKDPKRFNGKGVKKAIDNINKIIKKEIIGLSVEDQRFIDNRLIDIDGTENKKNLGANAILGVSLATAHSRAKEKKIPLFADFKSEKNIKYNLPIPLMNILNGGSHANNNIDFQEFMIVPVGAKSFKESVRMGAEIFHSLKKILDQKGYNTSVGDEGGFAPSLNSNQDAIELILESIENTSYKQGKDIFIALDVAASEIYENYNYNLSSEKRSLSSDKMIQYYETLVDNYPIISIEDGLDENDWDGWRNLTSSLGEKCQIVGDDLTVTNKLFLEKAINLKAINSILIKLNQIGTISETIDTIMVAKKNKVSTIVSHRSGETEDTTISDFAVGLSSGQIKAGSLCRTDRVAKYNQLIRIEDRLKDKAQFSPLHLSKYLNADEK